MKEHFVRQADSVGGWTLRPSLYSILHLADNTHLFPYGIHLMDNDELILLSGLHHILEKRYACVVAFSRDLGVTWSDPRDTGVYGRPVATAYLGEGRLLFANETLSRANLTPQWTTSEDYGRTWQMVGPAALTADGHQAFGEGDVFVDAAEGAPRIIQTLAFHTNFPVGRHTACVRSSADGGRTWTDEVSPSEWIFEVEHDGKRFERSVCEGTLIRAKNGWLVAALRTDMPPRYFDVPNNDGLMGLATSVSKDDGRSWSPLNILYDAGRHHPNLLLLPTGDIVMTYIVRVDVRDGALASYRRGCEAVVSRDNGVTWDTEHTYFLDEYEFFDGQKWFNEKSGHLSSTLLPDGSILTVYGNYLSKGAALIRWNVASRPL